MYRTRITKHVYQKIVTEKNSTKLLKLTKLKLKTEKMLIQNMNKNMMAKGMWISFLPSLII